MKKRLKKIFTLNKKHVNNNGAEVNCIHCGLGYDLRKRKPRTQDDLLNFISDPKTIEAAVEGSMDKRNKVMEEYK